MTPTSKLERRCRFPNQSLGKEILWKNIKTLDHGWNEIFDTTDLAFKSFKAQKIEIKLRIYPPSHLYWFNSRFNQNTFFLYINGKNGRYFFSCLCGSYFRQSITSNQRLVFILDQYYHDKKNLNRFPSYRICTMKDFLYSATAFVLSFLPNYLCYLHSYIPTYKDSLQQIRNRT